LNIGGGRKPFVLELLPESTRSSWGDGSDLLASGLIATEVNWLIDAPTARSCASRRSATGTRGVRATVTALPNGGAEVRFGRAATAVDAGAGGRVLHRHPLLGGGWIEQAKEKRINQKEQRTQKKRKNMSILKHCSLLSSLCPLCLCG